MLHSVVSDQGLHCLLGTVCPNTKGYHDDFFMHTVFILRIKTDKPE